MQIRNLFICTVISILLTGLFVIPVSAHGHHDKADSVKYSLCMLDDCTETEYHTHDGQIYCGYEHSCGYCDGSCTKDSKSKTPVHSRNHHGRHHNRHHG